MLGLNIVWKDEDCQISFIKRNALRAFYPRIATAPCRSLGEGGRRGGRRPGRLRSLWN